MSGKLKSANHSGEPVWGGDFPEKGTPKKIEQTPGDDAHKSTIAARALSS